jgi:hypothetical protein
MCKNQHLPPDFIDHNNIQPAVYFLLQERCGKHLIGSKPVFALALPASQPADGCRNAMPVAPNHARCAKMQS